MHIPFGPADLPSRRQVLLGAAALAAAGAAPRGWAQEAYPNRTVKLFVGASAGGAPDAVGRAMAKLLGDSWGQAVVIDNKPGIAGLLAAEAIAKLPPDGYALSLLLDSPITSVPFMTDKLPVDPITELRPVALIATFPLVLVAHPSVKYRNLKEMVAAAKAAPGKLDYCSSGVGSSGHLAMEMVQSAAGIKMNHLPYKGGLPALQDVMAGHVPLLWGSVTACAPQVRAGKVIALAMGSAERFPLLPEVPTAIEQGFAGFTAGNWLGVFGPAKLPDALVQKLQADFARLNQVASYREALLSQGIEPRNGTSEELKTMVLAEYQRNKALFPSLGIKPQ